jgi:hypothetical protein
MTTRWLGAKLPTILRWLGSLAGSGIQKPLTV